MPWVEKMTNHCGLKGRETVGSATHVGLEVETNLVRQDSFTVFCGKALAAFQAA